jgi:hypothetical protein
MIIATNIWDPFLMKIVTSVSKDDIFVKWYCSKCGVNACSLLCRERAMENVKCDDSVTNLLMIETRDIEDLDERVAWAATNRCRIGNVMGYNRTIVQFEDERAHVAYKLRWG